MHTGEQFKEQTKSFGGIYCFTTGEIYSRKTRKSFDLMRRKCDKSVANILPNQI